MNYKLERPSAIAHLRGDAAHPVLRGTVRFYPQSRGTLVVADIIGLPDSQSGFFGFHIHEGSDCAGTGFAATGNHFDPKKRPHPQHAGDLPPLLGDNGTAWLAVLSNRFQIQDIIGKTVVIHSKSDDFTTQPSGNAGTKIACGVIQRA